MNLVLTYCWKEWRAQRGLLLAYVGLVFTCLCLGLSMAPTHFWFDDGLGVHALSWFVTAGVIGVIAFVAPALVRAEYGPKDDLFIRRLPGALWPAFGGKLLFLLLATAGLPLLGLCVGEIFVQARGANWNDLFQWQWDGTVWLRWPAVLLFSMGALVLVPWVWAIGTWLPGGRMALGGTILFVLLCGVGVFAVMRQSPGIESGLDWQMWLWAVPPVGLVVAAISWGKGRRGGGALRSARLGLLAAGIAFVPPASWLADRAYDYHHPDLGKLVRLDVQGLSPDGRFALARGAANENFHQVSLRIDLATGSAEQLTGVTSVLSPELIRPAPLAMTGRQRLWRLDDQHDHPKRVLDLASGLWTPVGYDAKRNVLLLPDSLRAIATAEARAAMSIRAPGGSSVWMENGALCREAADGTATQEAWPEDRRGPMRAAGHGFWQYGRDDALFDHAGRKIPMPGQCAAFVVRDQVLYVRPGGRAADWLQTTIGEPARRCEALEGSYVIGLFDDDHVLCAAKLNQKQQNVHLFLYRPADGTTSAIAGMPELAAQSMRDAPPLYHGSSLLDRDPQGRIWLRCSQKDTDTFVLLDAATRSIVRVAPCPEPGRWQFQILAWLGGDGVLVSHRAQIVEWNVASGERSVLFPRR